MLLKHRVNWSTVCDAIGVLPWRSIWSADNPVERLNVHLSLLVEHFVLTKVICVRNKYTCPSSICSRIVHAIKIKSNPMQPLSGALPLPYELACVTRGALVVHRHLFMPPRCRTSQYCRSFVPLSVSIWNNLSDPVFDGVALAGFKSRANAFLLG